MQNQLCSKTQQVRDAVQNNDKLGAFRIAKTFKVWANDNDRKQVVRGYECLTRGDFYKQLGYVPQEEVDKGWEILKNTFTPKQRDTMRRVRIENKHYIYKGERLIAIIANRVCCLDPDGEFEDAIDVGYVVTWSKFYDSVTDNALDFERAKAC